MKNGWGRYATKERFKQKGYFRKHCDGSTGRKAREASRCNCIQQSRKKQEEIDVSNQLYEKIIQLEEMIEKTEEKDEFNGRGKCDSQQENSDGIIMVEQAITGKKPRSRRKKEDHKKHV